MNLMSFVLSTEEYNIKNKNIVRRIDKAKKAVKDEKLKIKKLSKKIGDVFYCDNYLPLISEDRDILKKSTDICSIRVNWKNLSFENMTTDEIVKELKPQFAFNITIVDREHTRNKFKNKSVCWVVFDTKEQAKKALQIFNSMFITAIELDCIEEYKRFKLNPEKKPLTFDKLVENAYELYEQVDKGEI